LCRFIVYIAIGLFFVKAGIVAGYEENCGGDASLQMMEQLVWFSIAAIVIIRGVMKFATQA
jgi:hypothetical protein